MPTQTPSQRISVPVRPAIAVLMATSILSAGCSSDGLSEAEVRVRFLEQRADFEELRSMVQDDSDAFGLRFVSVDAGDPARCGTRGDDQTCLSDDRRDDYTRRLRKVGILWIDRAQDPTRTYFVLHYRPFLTDARLRGFVHAAEGVEAERLDPRQEWHLVSEGWHTYLMIDS